MTAAPVTPVSIDGPEAFRRAFRVTGAQMDRLRIYADLLQKWQKAVNLVAPDSLSALWSRHFADSAQLVPLIGSARICVDFGSGAGFPGLVCAVLMVDTGETSMHLIESNARKCAFLRDVARQTGTAVEIHNARIEDVAAQSKVVSADVVMARGVAPLDRLLELAAPFFYSGAAGLFPKGRRALQEAAEARRTWQFELRTHASMTDPDGRILEIRAPRRVEGRTR
jgi:16S rRNA (guanine527-N7)-methyltransferase